MHLTYGAGSLLFDCLVSRGCLKELAAKGYQRLSLGGRDQLQQGAGTELGSSGSESCFSTPLKKLRSFQCREGNSFSRVQKWS